VELKRAQVRSLRGWRSRLNRTRVELKLRVVSITLGTDKQFESNQSGIETRTSEYHEQVPDTFESNQSGIETSLSALELHAVVRFESNQSGIETRRAPY